MGALPKRRTSTHRKGRRRKNKTLNRINLIPCPNCLENKLPHQICKKCGK